MALSGCSDGGSPSTETSTGTKSVEDGVNAPDWLLGDGCERGTVERGSWPRVVDFPLSADFITGMVNYKANFCICSRLQQQTDLDCVSDSRTSASMIGELKTGVGTVNMHITWKIFGPGRCYTLPAPRP